MGGGKGEDMWKEGNRKGNERTCGWEMKGHVDGK
jgi:hypothetical protein